MYVPFWLCFLSVLSPGGEVCEECSRASGPHRGAADADRHLAQPAHICRPPLDCSTDHAAGIPTAIRSVSDISKVLLISRRCKYAVQFGIHPE